MRDVIKSVTDEELEMAARRATTLLGMAHSWEENALVVEATVVEVGNVPKLLRAAAAEVRRAANQVEIERVSRQQAAAAAEA